MSDNPIDKMTVVQRADRRRVGGPDLDSHEVSHGEVRYVIHRLRQYDEARTSAYQRLRREVFVEGLGWQIPVDSSGRERDRYDVALEGDEYVHSYGIYHRGQDRLREHLVGGIRIIILRSWADSMLFNESRASGMLPDTVAEYLGGQPCTQFLELTRLCIRPDGLRDKLAAVRDYLYATVYRCAEHSTRSYAMAIAHPSMLAVLRRSHFAFHILHAQAGQDGYALVSVDLAATIDALRARQAHERVARLLCLCHCSEEGLDGAAQPAIV